MMFHTNPNILHYKNNESNGIMKAGHTFTIEPMIFEGTGKLPLCFCSNGRHIRAFVSNLFVGIGQRKYLATADWTFCHKHAKRVGYGGHDRVEQ